ncbi:hypothetical protein P692DRAFT_20883168 [Suillus brevipes Sb2]|nr:hypothetical protein P692DRAFT_20883168 [Suillus brevipes Sb2]
MADDRPSGMEQVPAPRDDYTISQGGRVQNVMKEALKLSQTFKVVHVKKEDGGVPTHIKKEDGGVPTHIKKEDGGLPIHIKKEHGGLPTHIKNEDGPTTVPLKKEDGVSTVPVKIEPEELDTIAQLNAYERRICTLRVDYRFR